MKLVRPPATKESMHIVWSLLLWNANNTVGRINWRPFHKLVLCKWKSQTGYLLCI